jgi:hypothetical protein
MTTDYIIAIPIYNGGRSVPAGALSVEGPTKVSSAERYCLVGIRRFAGANG